MSGENIHPLSPHSREAYPLPSKLIPNTSKPIPNKPYKPKPNTGHEKDNCPPAGNHTRGSTYSNDGYYVAATTQIASPGSTGTFCRHEWSSGSKCLVYFCPARAYRR